MNSFAILPTLKILPILLIPACLLATWYYRGSLFKINQAISNMFRSEKVFAYQCALLVMRIYKGIWGLRHQVYGLENLPPGPKILTANHPNASDALQLPLVFKEQLTAIAQENLFHLPIFGWIITHSGSIPVQRERPRQAFEQACKAIYEGASILIFPEGTLNPDKKEIKVGSGAVRLSLATGAPIIPVGICVAEQDTIIVRDAWERYQAGRWQFRGKFVVRIGKAWWPKKEISHEGKPVEIRELTRCLMDRIDTLIR